MGFVQIKSLKQKCLWFYIWNTIGNNAFKMAANCWSSVWDNVVGYKSSIWYCDKHREYLHYSDVIMGVIASQITSLTIVCSTVYSDADQRKHQSSASLAFVQGIHRGPVNSPHKWPVMQKMFPFDDVIMSLGSNYEHTFQHILLCFVTGRFCPYTSWLHHSASEYD